MWDSNESQYNYTMSVKESKRAKVVFELEMVVASIDKCLMFKAGCQSCMGRQQGCAD